MTRLNLSEDRTFKVLAHRAVEIAHRHHHELIPGVLSSLLVMRKILPRFDKTCDIFILSKGHAAPALYSFLEYLGYHPDLSNMFPQRDVANGIYCTTGSLGHGLPLAVGIALARKRRVEASGPVSYCTWDQGGAAMAQAYRDTVGIVYVLMGDGECLEGTTWESLCVAAHLELTNLEVHIDGNRCASLGDVPVNVAPSLATFFPQLVTYHNTVKGAGISFLEGTKEHKRTLTEAEFEQAMKELEP